MVTTLSTRTSVLGVTNPKRGYNPATTPVSDAVAISGPLLSRFDTVLLLSDAHAPA